MTKTERTELRRIVRRRFAVLHQQVVQRENEIAMAIRKRIVEDSKADLEAATEQAEEINERFRELDAAAEAFVNGIYKRGIIAEGGRRFHSGVRGGELFLPIRYEPKDLGKRVQEELAELRASAGYKRLDLNQLEQELDEELALGALESEDAKQFLEKIPTVEKLIPLPEGLELRELSA